MKKTMPTMHLLSGARYTNSTNTNVRITWLANGWKPPERNKQQAEMIRLNRMQTSGA